jgi:hypothetical protein
LVWLGWAAGLKDSQDAMGSDQASRGVKVWNFLAGWFPIERSLPATTSASHCDLITQIFDKDKFCVARDRNKKRVAFLP